MTIQNYWRDKMYEYKSAQELILKAALRDGVSTTIRPYCGIPQAIEVVFSAESERSAVAIDLTFSDERMVLRMLREALFRLFEAPYKEIVVEEGFKC